VDDASRHADLTIQATRRIATDLRPAILDHLGLVEALEFYGREFHGRTGIEVRVHSAWAGHELNADQRTALFRIVQESLTNVARHARASAVSIGLAGRATLLTLTVEDNGAGFSPWQHRTHSLGLLGMEERARAANGTLTINSAPGAGAKITVQLRLDPQ
jgi:signal transduction histidine kinase